MATRKAQSQAGIPVQVIDTDWLEGWLAHRVSLTGPLTVRQIAGGRSNLTYEVRDATGRGWVLRRPPLHTVHPTAHDVGREHRVLEALAGTSVPVPACVGLDVDPAGASFYVMEFVPGVVLRGAADVEAHLPRARRAEVADELVRTLAELHAIAPDAVGLDDLGRGVGYAHRQLHRWQEQADTARSEAHPLSDEVHAELVRRLPPDGDTVIVHGDHRIDNTIVAPGTGRIRAVVDWELCTLGDPLVDLAVTLSYWTLPSDDVRPLGDAPTLAPGFPPREHLLELYAAYRDRDLPPMSPYIAFALWRLGVVLEGVHARFSRGGYDAAVAPSDLDTYPEVARRLVRSAADILAA